MSILQVGARAVVASLWTVDDFATALLMGKFYKEWNQGAISVAKALQRAQKWLRSCSRQEITDALDELDELWATWAVNKADLGMQRRAVEQYWFIKEARRNLARMDDPPFAHPYWWAAFQAIGDVL